MHKEAITEWGKALTLSGVGEQASILERTYAASGFEAAVRALAQQRLEKLNERMKHGEYVPAIEYATAYTRLGDKEQARQQFMEAANLAPGDKVIWDSPALSPFGNPKSTKVYKQPSMGPTRSGPVGGPR